jgi:hypothetical protein
LSFTAGLFSLKEYAPNAVTMFANTGLSPSWV